MDLDNVAEIIDSILPGESVLLKYHTSYIPEFILRFFIDYSKERGVSLLVDDNFDSLNTIAIHAKTLGLPPLDLDGVYVVKTGGKYEVGNVVTRVPFHPDPRVYLENYEEASRKAFNDLQPPYVKPRSWNREPLPAGTTAIGRLSPPPGDPAVRGGEKREEGILPHQRRRCSWSPVQRDARTREDSDDGNGGVPPTERCHREGLGEHQPRDDRKRA